MSPGSLLIVSKRVNTHNFLAMFKVAFSKMTRANIRHLTTPINTVDMTLHIAELPCDENNSNIDLRVTNYSLVDICLVFFDLSNKQSLENLTTKWLPELQNYLKTVPKILVGCKRDIAEEINLESSQNTGNYEDLELGFIEDLSNSTSMGPIQNAQNDDMKPHSRSGHVSSLDVKKVFQSGDFIDFICTSAKTDYKVNDLINKIGKCCLAQDNNLNLTNNRRSQMKKAYSTIGLDSRRSRDGSKKDCVIM